MNHYRNDYTNTPFQPFAERRFREPPKPKNNSFRVAKSKRGQYEIEIAQRLGTDGIDVFAALPKWELQSLCDLQMKGILDQARIDKVRSIYFDRLKQKQSQS